MMRCRPVSSIADAIAQMEGVGAALPAADGLAAFNRMYLGVTQAVQARIVGSFFADAGFMSRLDVVFANLYFAAADASLSGASELPRAWAPLLQRRQDPSVAPIQFALAGMNAHINHDLPQAVVDTCQQAGTAPGAPPHHDDYQKVDPILEAAEQQVRESFESGAVASADKAVAPVANVVCNWSIAEARNAAWTNALALWVLRGHSTLEADYLDALAGTVGLASRGLLAPTPGDLLTAVRSV
ncbi:MAG TPA: DUF5995 family protein [Acidimicrobiales bacterium]|nr:DUF5995 family protein [Acidimicrobiales bacterium]